MFQLIRFPRQLTNKYSDANSLFDENQHSYLSLISNGQLTYLHKLLSPSDDYNID